jgi:hypothetical protein
MEDKVKGVLRFFLMLGLIGPVWPSAPNAAYVQKFSTS